MWLSFCLNAGILAAIPNAKRFSAEVLKIVINHG